jgi:hypothetical protein
MELEKVFLKYSATFQISNYKIPTIFTRSPPLRCNQHVEYLVLYEQGGVCETRKGPFGATGNKASTLLFLLAARPCCMRGKKKVLTVHLSSIFLIKLINSLCIFYFLLCPRQRVCFSASHCKREQGHSQQLTTSNQTNTPIEILLY